jgi:hypothetical protein
MNDSPWRAKPWWCQPWSVALTGCLLIAASLRVLPFPWGVVPAVPVAVWMGYFLFVWPRSMRY